MYNLILLAAGREKRFDKKNKLFVEISGKPLICHPLETFENDKHCKSIVVVTREEYLDTLNSICKDKKYSKVKKIVIGGEKRQNSVNIGIKYFTDDEFLLAVHSVTYPFVSEKELNNLYFAALEEDAVTLGHPLEESVKVTDKTMHVAEIESRDNRWISHSPTMTSIENWRRAYSNGDNMTEKPSDEASMLIRAGVKVQLVPDFRSNIPIYTTFDWKLSAKQTNG